MKTRTAKMLFILIVVLSMLPLTACGANNFVNIPAGYAGMILTPTGWTNKWLEAGQVDLGIANDNGSYNSLVLLEVTSTTVKEQFLGVGETAADGTVLARDDRVLTQDSVPLSVDVYVRAMVPEDKEIRSAILAQVTPVHFEGDPAVVQRITVEQIYTKFAKPETRSSVARSSPAILITRRFTRTTLAFPMNSAAGSLRSSRTTACR